MQITHSLRPLSIEQMNILSVSHFNFCIRNNSAKTDLNIVIL